MKNKPNLAFSKGFLYGSEPLTLRGFEIHAPATGFKEARQGGKRFLIQRLDNGFRLFQIQPGGGPASRRIRLDQAITLPLESSTI